ncbi:kinase with adenine nucleotide alpha hydrolases-like domain-containing protein [Actinidia rufa]|uniref:Kinase with adenine nucleotide alpha hydrolases-like domain-containing protein n=1 Tax=Actinidia rufa TaxID=165716 RepID=A0A7J0EY44_9ERIC|nr:kinase with adenine nucleotide alpha hydrolases-like domain-containing protein [Actinidia rufa]
MKLVGNCTEPEECGVDAASEGGGGAVVVVGVRMDSQSRELLTWALVKVARSGDRVIALHVLNPITESKSTLLSLVKTFDSMLAAYEGFCSLKQVDLKLKVCRGSSVCKILVREAKCYGAANVIVGTSKCHHTIRSSVSVAKYCAKNLPRNFLVLAVDNGKILFQSEASDAIVCGLRGSGHEKHYTRSIHQSLSKVPKASKSNEGQGDSQKLNSTEESLNGDSKENALALVPAKSKLWPEANPGWALLRWVFLPNQKRSDKSSFKKSIMKGVLNLPRRQSLAAVFPDHRRNKSDRNEDDSLISFSDIALSPSSPGYCLKSHSKELKELAEKYSSACRLFSYQELLHATSNFKPENVIGKGGSSHVYKGFLPDGKELAVKVLKPSEDVFRQFVLEIEIITVLNHKNIISLLGFCFDGNNLLLVYNFLSRGSLQDNLHGNRKNGNKFGWEDRFKVALGAAEALDYLHNRAVEPVIHRDVKSSNILLSDDFEPQLSDFGLAVRASDSSHYTTCTDVAGTYLAPEYFMHGKVNDRIDVYSFGVVLLELLSGKKPIDNGNPKGLESLVMWGKSIVKDGDVSQLLDPSFFGRAPIFRPEISLVLKLLQGDADSINWARQQVSASEELDDVDGEEFPANMQSHLNLALLDVGEDSLSIGSTNLMSR